MRPSVDTCGAVPACGYHSPELECRETRSEGDRAAFTFTRKPPEEPGCLEVGILRFERIGDRFFYPTLGSAVASYADDYGVAPRPRRGTDES